MTPEQHLKTAILHTAAKHCQDIVISEICPENIDEKFQQLAELYEAVLEAHDEVRRGQVATGLQCDWSRHYESKAVAAKMPDGTWVGWTYWYGGGKHSAPEEVDWMDSAYFLRCTEEQKLVTVRTFEREESAKG